MERVNIVNKTTGGRTSTTRRALALGFLAPEWAEEDTEAAVEVAGPNPGAGDQPETAAITSRPRRRAGESAETRKG